MQFAEQLFRTAKEKWPHEKALAAIKEELPADAFTCETIEDILQLAKDIAYASPLH